MEFLSGYRHIRNEDGSESEKEESPFSHQKPKTATVLEKTSAPQEPVRAQEPEVTENEDDEGDELGEQGPESLEKEHQRRRRRRRRHGQRAAADPSEAEMERLRGEIARLSQESQILMEQCPAPVPAVQAEWLPDQRNSNWCGPVGVDAQQEEVETVRRQERVQEVEVHRGLNTPGTPSGASSANALPRELLENDIVCDLPPELRTTVMLRNLPNNYTRAMVLQMLDDEGFAAKYNFLYLPIDFHSRACLGYAFINLMEPALVPRFFAKFSGYSKWVLPSRKMCGVSWSGPHQGLMAHAERYRNSPVMHASVPDEYKPVVLQDGVRVAFPPPTKAPRAPRLRHHADTKAHWSTAVMQQQQQVHQQEEEQRQQLLQQQMQVPLRPVRQQQFQLMPRNVMMPQQMAQMPMMFIPQQGGAVQW